MTGITILNTSEYLVDRIGGSLNFNSIMFGIIGILCLVCFIWTLREADNSCPAFLIGIFVSGVLAVSFWHMHGAEVTIPQYQVTIDNSVSYIDFTDKYKVIKQEGRIYTIIDKEELKRAEEIK